MKELICADDFFPTIESDVKDTLCSPSEGSRDDPLMPTIRIGCSMWTKGLFAEGLRISRAGLLNRLRQVELEVVASQSKLLTLETYVAEHDSAESLFASSQTTLNGWMLLVIILGAPGIMYIYLCVFMVATNVLNKINSSSSPKVQTNLDGDASPASMV
mmetsp:Transcript_32294/g.63157  ORF Transcript_32294/g.63157 Transcript_32294/m.63157 type:complete len:159 (+) Transcript_32294:104-580(+)